MVVADVLPAVQMAIILFQTEGAQKVAEQFGAEYGPFAYALVLVVGGLLAFGAWAFKIEWNRKNEENQQLRDELRQANERSLKHQETMLKALGEVVMVLQTFKGESYLRDDANKKSLTKLEQSLVERIVTLQNEVKEIRRMLSQK